MPDDSAALHTLSVTELADRIRSGTLSPVSIVETCLARIEQLEPVLRAWVFLETPGALETARSLEAEARASRFRGLLHGVPVAVKDIYDAAGMVTRSGAASFAHRRPEKDAESVARLRRAGAIILGKTTTTEFAYADPAETRNPWNLEHTPGGSSSGSAAAVAARMVPLAMGSQTIGSTLRPAAYCGIVGLKPTYGLISTEGVTPLAWSLDHVGIFTRNVDDAVLVFSVLTGSQFAGGSLGASPPHLGIPRAFFEEVATKEVRDHLQIVVAEFAHAGAAIEEVALPPSASQIQEAGMVVLRVEAAAYHAGQFSVHARSYSPRIRELVETGRKVQGVDYVAAQQIRRRFQEEMAPIFEEYDALLMPVVPAPAPPLTRGTTGDPVLCAPWSFGGFPASALPSGLSGQGLPLAIQLIAGAGAEARLLNVARWCEARLNFTAAPSL